MFHSWYCHVEKRVLNRAQFTGGFPTRLVLKDISHSVCPDDAQIISVGTLSVVSPKIVPVHTQLSLSKFHFLHTIACQLSAYIYIPLIHADLFGSGFLYHIRPVASIDSSLNVKQHFASHYSHATKLIKELYSSNIMG